MIENYVNATGEQPSSLRRLPRRARAGQPLRGHTALASAAASCAPGFKVTFCRLAARTVAFVAHAESQQHHPRFENSPE